MTVPRPSGTRRKGSSPVGLVKGIPWWQFEGSTGMDPDQIRHAGQERVRLPSPEDFLCQARPQRPLAR